MAYEANRTGTPSKGWDEKHAERVLKGYARAKTRRQPWEGVINEIYDYTMPNRAHFHEVFPAQRRTDFIFDETAVVSVPEFASRIQQGSMPSWQRWLRLEPGREVNEDRNVVQANLDEVTDAVFAELNSSNFATEVHESLQDLAVGTCNLLMEDGGKENTFKFTSVPQNQVYILNGPFGMIDRIYRMRRIEAQHVGVVWRDATLTPEIRDVQKNKPEQELTFIEAVERDYTAVDDERWTYCVIDEKRKHTLVKLIFKGQGSSPWINGRWSRLGGEDYGRGPLFNAMPAIKTCNLTVQLILENAQMAIAGIYTAPDDGVLNPDNLEIVPGAIIPHAPGNEGLKAVQSHARFDVAQLVLEDQRHNIKKALYNETLGPREGTPPSATEVAERMADLFRQMGSPLQRVFLEIALPVFTRATYIMRERGMIELPRIDGKLIKPRFVSPLARAQQSEDFASAARFLQTVAGLMGPDVIKSVVKTQETVSYLADLNDFPARLVSTKQEVEQIAANMAEASKGMIEAGASPDNVVNMAGKMAGGGAR